MEPSDDTVTLRGRPYTILQDRAIPKSLLSTLTLQLEAIFGNGSAVGIARCLLSLLYENGRLDKGDNPQPWNDLRGMQRDLNLALGQGNSPLRFVFGNKLGPSGPLYLVDIDEPVSKAPKV